ncbi:Tad domain-containing protein [Marivita hallyeonensis]|uniref:Flp pilus assembly protein TadG n=1 Tax=Marivita hallyeonensis TaxID=996342 RepID=A0A1M5MR73_9RHOB|nr:Tad domain-containing protein [Marivita hallyeonensis]SHG79696.1 Flp pilus assembly protein TadG [Marivita hallyeonensis]
MNTGTVRHYLKREDGNVTVFSIFMGVLILVITGASVDLMRLESTRVALQSTMDRAVIAAADLDQTQDPSTVVEDYLNKASMSGALNGVSVETALNARTVSANGSTDLDTFFMRMSGWDTLTAPALSTADERIANVEISLVLDISGSMRHNERMTRMKPAAQDFVRKVMSDESSGVTTLNLVPFAGHVNPGDTLFDFFRGERPKLKKGNNGWGNGDQDAPGGSLCNNNAENADEALLSPECGNAPVGADAAATIPLVTTFFPEWPNAIETVMFYFDTDEDDVYNRAHKVTNIPVNAPRDADHFFRGLVAYLMAQDSELSSPGQFLGMSIEGGWAKDTKYFQVKGDQNMEDSDIGPSKHKGKFPGNTYDYAGVDIVHWTDSYVSPNIELVAAEGGANTSADTTTGADSDQNINMPSSCVEIYDNEFMTTAMPLSDDYVPHFMFWEIDREVMQWGWCPGEDATIQYYSADRQFLVDYIGDMPMYDGTGLPYGMKYALALLDPGNRDEVSFLITEGLVDSRFEGRPIDWNDTETEKYIVLMTDGQTTDQYRPNDPKAAINSEVELNNQGSGTYHNFSVKSNNISNLLAQCELAKELGVTVFTIAFETNASATNDMKACASSVSHFFHVQGEEISDAFDMVARQINNLRLIQ